MVTSARVLVDILIMLTLPHNKATTVTTTTSVIFTAYRTGRVLVAVNDLSGDGKLTSFQMFVS